MLNNITLAYLLMLMVMSYHIAIFIIAIFSCGVSNFICLYIYTSLLKHRRNKQILKGDAGPSNQSSVLVQLEDGDHCCQSGVQVANHNAYEEI